MATRKFASLILAASFTSTAVASDDGWTVVFAKTDTNEYTMKVDSFEVTTTKGGDEVASVIGRDMDTKKNRVTVEKWYVKTTDCTKGYGTLVILSITGEYKYESSFVEKDGSIGAAIADVICGVHKGLKEEAAKKSL